MFWSIAKTTTICVLAALVLWQVDRGIWRQACYFRSIRTSSDPLQIEREHRNRFLVPAKIVPFFVTFAGVFLIAVEDSLVGLAISMIGIVWYGSISMVYARRALRKFT